MKVIMACRSKERAEKAKANVLVQVMKGDLLDKGI